MKRIKNVISINQNYNLPSFHIKTYITQEKEKRFLIIF